jgi:hypothetical protein
MNKFFKVMIASCLVVSFMTDATLRRFGGRGSETSTSPNSYYLIDDSWVVLYPGGGLTLDANNYNDAFRASPRQSTTFGKYKLLVVPFNGCAEEFSFGTYAGVPDEFLPVWDGCTWEFTEDDRLFAYGDFPLYLEGAFDYNIVFSITNDSGDRWELMGTDTYADKIGGSLLPDGDTSSEGMVFLDAKRPKDLVPGEYSVSVSVEMISGPDKTFFHYQDENSGLNVGCVTILTPDDFCFVSGGLRESETLSFTADFSETLRILPSIVSVNIPNSISLLFGSLCLMFYQRKKRNNNN